jgi:hypothetical protein
MDAYLRKHFDTSGKSAALLHHRAISKTAHGAERDHGQLRGIGGAQARRAQCRMSATP